MAQNSSFCTGFPLFRNSNLLTAHEHVVNSYIVANLYISIYLLCPCWRRTSVGTPFNKRTYFETDPRGVITAIHCTSAECSYQSDYTCRKSMWSHHSPWELLPYKWWWFSSEDFENTPKRYQSLVLWACPKFIFALKGYHFNNNKLYNWHCIC